MELTIYALIYWNDNFKNEVKKMLNKKVLSMMFLLGAYWLVVLVQMILVMIR